MKARQLFPLAAALALAAPVAAQNVVSQPEKRESMLAEVEALLQPERVDLAAATVSRSSPFSAVTAVVAASDSVAADSERVVVSRLSDEVALEAAARSFRPSGSIIGSSRRILRLANGEMMDEGAHFTATIRGSRYDVQVERVSVDGYVLRLGEARLERNFLDPSSGGGVIRTSPQQESPEP